MPTPFVVRYNPDMHPNRVAPPVTPRRTVPYPPPSPSPAPAPAPAPAPTAVAAEAATAELGATTAGVAPTLTAAQVAEGARLVSITKPQAASRLGITLGSGEESLLHISSLAPDALGAKSGELEVGDALLAVNGVLVYNHLEASTMIKETAGTVHLTIKRPSTPPTATVATAAATTAAAVAPAPAPAQTPTSPDVAGAPSDVAAVESEASGGFFGGVANGLASLGKSASNMLQAAGEASPGSGSPGRL